MDDFTLAVTALALSILSFLGGVWKCWRDRPRVYIYVSKVTLSNLEDKPEMMKIRVCNLGFRSVIIKKCEFIGKKSLSCVGNSPLSQYGIHKNTFPILIEPGKELEFFPHSIEQFKKMTCKNSTHSFRFFFLTDNFNKKKHYYETSDLRFHLGLDKSYKPRGVLGKIKGFTIFKYYLFKNRKMLNNPLYK